MALTLADLKGKTVGVCVSGGLDSRTISKVMVEAGVNVIAFSADVGQPDEKDINDIRKRMAPCGVDTVIVDLKDEMADACFETLKAQAMYDGGYWNSTGIARAVTVKGLLPENLAAQGERLGRCAVVAQPVSALDPGVFEALLGAIANRQRVRFRYRSPYGDKAFREQHADPWGVFFRAHAWYLWGRTVAHGNESTWRVGRIRSLVPLGGEDYVPPLGDECLASLAASAWYAAPGEGRHPVSVRIRPPLASVVSETRWHPSQVLVQQDDGAVVLAARVPDLDEVARWVLASAPCAEVLEPSALADRVRELALEVAGIPEPAP